MGLKVWLPLNGDLHNQGTSNITFTGTPAWRTSGKIGNAAYNLSTRINFNCPALANVKYFSIAFWGMTEANTDSTANWMDILSFTDKSTGGTTGYFRFETGYGNTAYGGIHWHDNATNAIINGSYTYNTASEYGKWHHIVVTVSNTAVCSYYDGILKSTLTTNLGGGSLTGAGWIGESTTRGGIQDVRVYDHCLSAAEIKEISQGLVLHYKLDNITNEIQDSSGYGHNGSILNTVNISSDTPRYSYSTSLPNGNSMINCGRGGMVTDSITVSMWLKSSSWANPTSCTESGGWNFESTGNYFRFPIYISGVGYKYGQSATTKTQICNNQWHMLTGIYDRINQKVQIYVDGQLDNDYAAGTSNNIGYHGSNVIWIGAEATGSNTTASNGMAGLFSDYRIYCTALSADDVLQLYHTSAKVDNKQNIHIFEYIEDQTATKITKQGQFKCDEIVELTAAKIKKDKTIEAYEFIEL